MIRALSLSEPDRRLLPSSGLKGPVPVLFAVMMFIMVIVAAAGLVLANLASTVRSGIENRYTIQLADGSPTANDALAAARRSAGVERATRVPDEDIRRTLERWLGPAALDAGLPLPAMIDVELKPGANPASVAAAVKKADGNARMQSHRDTLKPLLRGLRWLGWLALGLVFLTGIAASAAVVLAARAALDSHRSTIDIMHGIGASDRQIARLFLRQIAGDALTGGLVGTALAGLILLVIASIGASGPMLVGSSGLGLVDALILAALPLLAAALATLVARRALLKTLGERL